MIRKYADQAFGELDAGIDASATTLSSPGFANLPELDGSGDECVIVTLNPGADDGSFEYVSVIGHAVDATTVTVNRAARGSTAAAHAVNTAWVAPGPVAAELDGLWQSDDGSQVSFAGRVGPYANYDAIAIGGQAAYDYAMAVGLNSSAYATYATALGNNAYAYYSNSIALGYGAQTQEEHEFTFSSNILRIPGRRFDVTQVGAGGSSTTTETTGSSLFLCFPSDGNNCTVTLSDAARTGTVVTIVCHGGGGQTSVAFQTDVMDGELGSRVLRPGQSLTVVRYFGAWYSINPGGTREVVGNFEVTGTARTLTNTDESKVIECTNAGATTITVPTDANEPALEIGATMWVYSGGAAGVTIAGDTGVDVRGVTALAQYDEVRLRKRAANEWVAS